MIYIKLEMPKNTEWQKQISTKKREKMYMPMSPHGIGYKQTWYPPDVR